MGGQSDSFPRPRSQPECTRMGTRHHGRQTRGSSTAFRRKSHLESTLPHRPNRHFSNPANGHFSQPWFCRFRLGKASAGILAKRKDACTRRFARNRCRPRLQLVHRPCNGLHRGRPPPAPTARTPAPGAHGNPDLGGETC